MHHFSDPAELRQWATQVRSAGQRLVLVPTMGALHRGHLSLIDLARNNGDSVLATIFVNPTQFAPGEDLDRYPRDVEGDLEKLRSNGCDAVFTPTPADIYPNGFDTYIEPAMLSEPLCGATRPGHFRGVATVVTVLLRMSGADVLVLGEKDFQQLQIIRRMIRDLWLDVEVISAPIVREDDGLALSSRNTYLSSEDRESALAIPRALEHVATQFKAGQRSVAPLLDTARATLKRSSLEVEYIAIVDAESLRPLDYIEQSAVIAIAARAGLTRLIDNRRLG